MSKTKGKKSRAAELVSWYQGARRDLPWRRDRDAYRIWISEVMLQQTTVVAVIPYYERFMKRFPSLASLAEAELEDVLAHWAGLGYYSRARNLHRAARELAEKGFPRTHAELAELPGFGPYTARAVASLAFGESTGVLDGNVIRVLSRLHGLAIEWWKPAGRARLQELADELARSEDPADVNQALMELGATVCTPTSPACLLCPWTRSCAARAQARIAELPLKKPRRARELWQWSPEIVTRAGRVLLVKNNYAPFLKGHLILPGSVRRLEKAPARFDYRGVVTHHDIFVRVTTASRPSLAPEAGQKWVGLGEELKKHIPASLIRKAIEKSAAGRLLCAALLFAALCSACSRAPLKPDKPPLDSPSTGISATPVTPLGAPLILSPTVAQSAGGALVAKPLTGSGDNSDGRFSPDGTRIVFVSRFRPTHKQAQVYELHLGRMTEKRITYHDGDDAGPVYAPDGARLVFASSTDEIKNPGFAVQRLMRTYAPDLANKNAPPPEAGFELYEQTLHGRAIERLSQSPGFDGDADIDPKSGKRLVFSSSRSSEGTHLYLQQGRASASRLTEGKVIDRGARFSADGSSLAWSRQVVDKSGNVPAESRLMIAHGNFRNPKVLVETRGLHLHPAWHPGGGEIVFSSNMAGKHYNLYAIDRAGGCPRRLTNAEADQLQPAFSPDGKKLLFTAGRVPGAGDHQQVFVMDYARPTDCWQQTPPSSSEKPGR